MKTYGPNEIPVHELLGDVPPYTDALFDPPIRSLPIEKISWDVFEQLIAYLLTATNKKINQAFRYGEPGHHQGGIDILATLHLSKKRIVAQCKHVRKLTGGELLDWANEILQRADLNDIEEVIYATTDNIERDPKLTEKWHTAHALLAKKKIKAVLWDFSIINRELHHKPNIVDVFFGPEISKKFCGQVHLADKYPTEYRRQFKTEILNGVLLENRSVRLDMFIPDSEHPGVSACFSFARADLRGISIAVDAQTIVEWMQWHAHRDRTKACPFLVELPGNQHSVLTAPTARLSLEPQEVEEINWVLAEAWSDYINAAKGVEQEWRTTRFPRVQDKSRSVAFNLFRVDSWFWRKTLEYASAHDYARGDSVSYIFESAFGALKVYVQKPRAGLNAGHHLIAYGRSIDNDVIVEWAPLMSIGSEPARFNPCDAWDAEHTHSWMLNTLFPEVLRWTISKEKRSKTFGWTIIDKIFRQSDKNNIRVPSVDDFVTSLAEHQHRNYGHRLLNGDEALDLINTLKSHFSTHHSPVAIEKRLVFQVIRLAARLAKQMTISNEQPDDPRYYIRSKLQLGDGELFDELENIVRSPDKIMGNAASLDYALRALGAIIEHIDNLPSAELDVIAESLNPIWDRYREDLICRSYV